MGGKINDSLARRRACITNWFYPLMHANVLMPQTEIIRTKCNLAELLDDKEPAGYQDFLQGLRWAVNQMGTPCFLRTGHTSGKHQWKDTCYLESAQDLEKHVFNLIEYSECANLFGLDYSVWAVRELLPTAPVFYAFNGMPITKERRYFAEEGRVLCFHPYWFEEVFKNENLSNDNLRALRDLNIKSEAEVRELTALTEKASRCLAGAWSFDWLWTARGWYLIDAAPMELSFHKENCKRNKEITRYANS